MSKRIKKSAGIQVDATMEKALVTAVENTCVPLTPEELIFGAQFIAGFQEMNVRFWDEIPFLFIGNLEKVCPGWNAAGKIDFPLATMGRTDIAAVSAVHVPDFIRAVSPSPRVAEYLMRWFEEYYKPRVGQLPSIYRRLRSERATWGRLEEQANRADILAEDMLQQLLVGGHDQLLDTFSMSLRHIKDRWAVLVNDDAVS